MAGSDPKGGIFSPHPAGRAPGARVAPTFSDELNVVRLPLTVVACASLPDTHFAFDSSIITPEAAVGLTRLARLRKSHQGSPATIFGHADPTGNDDYNKVLSGRRARAIFGLLVHDTDIWEDLFAHPHGRDDWTVKSVQVMLAALGQDPGDPDGKSGPKTVAALHAFQNSKGLPPTDTAGPRTRKQLFSDYMDFLYGKEFTKLDPKRDFLARGADPKGRGDVQGCGEFNPLLMVSKADDKRFQDPRNKDERDQTYAPTRRVMVFLFEEGTELDPAGWPCPAATEGTKRCIARFYSDAKKRRTFQDAERRYEDNPDTFACRFYDRIARGSPCERLQPLPLPPLPKFGTLDVLFRVGRGLSDRLERYRLKSVDGSYDQTLNRGEAVEKTGVLRLRFRDVPRGVDCTLFQVIGTDLELEIAKGLQVDAIPASL